MMYSSSKFAALATLVLGVQAECPNSCSGHGDCTQYDMCDCWRNWQASDCSERTCQFGLAHVDTPKGDLDMSGNKLSGPTETVISDSTTYPDGTTESFPSMNDAADTALVQTAHYYMECSNKGTCNRNTGICECIDGYDGSSCQRASCPNDCSRHGVCRTIQEIARDDYDNIYYLWDRQSTMGCVCDGGYYSPDCSKRRCKYGVDPLYIDDEATIRYPRFYLTLTDDDDVEDITGTFSINFYDAHGETWVTDPIESEDLVCADLVTAFEDLPNDVIAEDSVSCTLVETTAAATFAVTFTGNPGNLREFSVDRYLDGSSSTLLDDVEVDIYAMGITGEWIDHVPTLCDDLLVELTTVDNTTMTVVDSTTAKVKLLKACLGDSDGDSDNNVDVSNWDYGNQDTYDADVNPVWVHLVKFLPTDALDDEGGFYALTYFDGFKFYISSSLPSSDVARSTDLYLYTTDATLERIYEDDDGDAVEADEILITNTAWDNYFTTTVDISCQTGSGTSACLEKGDIVVLQDDDDSTFSSANLYEVKKIYWEDLTSSSAAQVYRVVLDKHLPISYTGGHVYKMVQGDESYEYVTECSSRGKCNEETALCECFNGYTNDNCDTQASIAH